MKRSLWLPAAALAATALLAVDARAAARPYAFVQGTDGLPQSSLELENWVGGNTPVSGPTVWDWWIGPVAGITDQWEAGLFTVFDQGVSAATTAPVTGAAGIPTTAAVTGFELQSLRLQVSYLLAPAGQWPVDVRLRLEGEVPVAPSAAATAWLDAFVGHNYGNFNWTANLAGSVEKHGDEFEPYAAYGLGLSYRIQRMVRVGAEGYGNVEFEKGVEVKNTAGPSLSFGRDRLWLTSSLQFGIGDESPKRVGRLVIGMSF